jgi:8-oxo-dGTP pyrophosphatase MutT (NUDIX family)
VAEPADESVNVYDNGGHVAGAMRRDDAKRSGLAVGAINVLLVNAHAEVLLQRRPDHKENGGRWDKSVGGHVDAGEDFDEAALREAGEELFGDGSSSHVHLAVGEEDFRRALVQTDLRRSAVFRREALQLGLRDVRLAPDHTVRNVVYHVASYLGRTDVALRDFRPPRDEIAALRYASPEQVDELLLRGELAPNMAFLWLTHARALIRLARPLGVR